MTDSPSPSPRPFFAPTRWSLVLRSKGDSPEARLALSDLCAAYCEPVYRALRSRGFDDDRSRDLSQEFFAHVLQGGRLEQADPQRGRFRSYLLGALQHFLSDLREKAGRQKRGDGLPLESLEEIPEPGVDGDALGFDRDWALAVMARGLEILGSEYREAGRSVWFEQLTPWLAGTEPAERQLDVAERLGLTEGALKVAIHRLRKRFREVILQEIRQTLPENGDANEELRYLIEVLVRG